MRTTRRSSTHSRSTEKALCLAALACLLTSSPVLAQDAPTTDEGAAVVETPVEDTPAPAEEEVAESGDAEGLSEEEMTGEDASEYEDEDERYVSNNINLDGGVGFHKIASANPGNAKMFRAAFLGEFYSGKDTIRQGDVNTRSVGRVLVQGTFTEYFAINFGLMAKSNVNTFGQPEAMLTQGDANLGFTGFYAINDYLTFGADLNLFVPASFGSAGLDVSSVSVRPRLLATLDTGGLTNGDVPLDVHLNVGYMVDRSANSVDGIDVTRVERFAYGISEYDLLELGIGFEYDLPYVKPFVGYWMGLPVNGEGEVCNDGGDLRGPDCAATVGIGAAPKLLSLGLKAEPLENLGIHAGVDLGLTTQDAFGLPATTPYNIVAGLSWTIDPTPKIEYVEIEKVIEKEKIVEQAAAMGYIMGTIVDEGTDESVRGAVIEYVGQDVSSQSSSTVNGTFRSYGFELGKEIKLRVTHPDYETLEVGAQIQEGDLPLSIALKALPKIGELKGRVLDDKDKPVKIARVSISGEGEKFTVPVDGGGNFSKDLKAGKYTIAVSAENYLTRGRDVTLKADDTVAIDVVLLPKPKKELAKLGDTRIEINESVYFDTGEATIQKRSFNLLTQVASVLLENPQVTKIQIEGHTDNKGAKDFNMDLSQRRADAVKKFLADQGISPDRVVSKGFGDSRPILPNTSNRNRGLNRRVEFNIVEQPAAKKDTP